MKKVVSVSLVISTYNRKDALNVCLLSVLQQSRLPDEVVIADDGSEEDTRQLVQEFAARFPVPLYYVWHEDNGFRLSAIRNKAFAQCNKEYIIQIDGDLILHRHFIKDHLRFALPGSFVSGSRVIVQKELTQRLLAESDIRVSIFTKGASHFINGIHCPCLSTLQQYYREKDVLYVRGCNMAFWKADLLKVNGYDETMTGWGREDNEIACRLINTGVRKRIIKFAGIVFHLYHKAQSRDKLNINDEILQHTIAHRITWCERGLSQHINVSTPYIDKVI